MARRPRRLLDMPSIHPAKARNLESKQATWNHILRKFGPLLRHCSTYLQCRPIPAVVPVGGGRIQFHRRVRWPGGPNRHHHHRDRYHHVQNAASTKAIWRTPTHSSRETTGSNRADDLWCHSSVRCICDRTGPDRQWQLVPRQDQLTI